MPENEQITTVDDQISNLAVVEAVRGLLPTERRVLGMAETFKVLADPTRLKITLVLAKAELCVGDVAALLNISPSAASHHLRFLRGENLVKVRKEGKMVFYSLEDPHIFHLVEECLSHIAERY